MRKANKIMMATVAVLLTLTLVSTSLISGVFAKYTTKKAGAFSMNFEEFLKKNPGAKIWMATTKAKHCYSDVSFGKDDYIMFGKESAGIPEEILVENEETCIRIPMLEKIRSLNLSNSVAIVLYEALRQNNFESMSLEGELHRLQWKNKE